MKQSHKTLLLWVLLIVMFLAIWNLMQQDGEARQVAFSEFVADVQAGRVTDVQVKPQDNSAEYTYIAPHADDTAADGEASDGRHRRRAAQPASSSSTTSTSTYAPDDQNGLWTSILVTWLPMIFLLVMFFLFMRQLQAAGGKAMSFGKSRARLLNEIAEQGDVRRRRRHRRGEGRLRRDHRLPQGPEEVPAARRPHPEGRAADGPAGHRQDAPRARHRGRGGRAVLQHLRLGLRRDVRRRRRLAASATSSSRARSTRPASSSSTRSTPSVVTAAPASAAVTTSASRR